MQMIFNQDAAIPASAARLRILSGRDNYQLTAILIDSEQRVSTHLALATGSKEACRAMLSQATQWLIDGKSLEAEVLQHGADVHDAD